MPTASSLPERLFSESQDAALQQIKERGALMAIDRGDIRRGNRPLQQYLGSYCRALVMVSSDMASTA